MYHHMTLSRACLFRVHEWKFLSNEQACRVWNNCRIMLIVSWPCDYAIYCISHHSYSSMLIVWSRVQSIEQSIGMRWQVWIVYTVIPWLLLVLYCIRLILKHVICLTRCTCVLVYVWIGENNLQIWYVISLGLHRSECSSGEIQRHIYIVFRGQWGISVTPLSSAGILELMQSDVIPSHISIVLGEQ